MREEDKELLLKDLSSRLKYGVICQVDDGAAGLNDGKLVEIDIQKELTRFDADFYWDAHIDEVKPYLRSMTSMTEEEKIELSCLFGGIPDEDYIYKPYTDISYSTFGEVIDWLNKHHFDYRGLIEKELALEAPEGMYNIK